jgi:hypothetical protein
MVAAGWPTIWPIVVLTVSSPEVHEYAWRRPGTFLATALVAGFVVGRLGKGVMNASDSPTATTGKPRGDAFVSDVPVSIPSRRIRPPVTRPARPSRATRMTAS